MQRPPTTHTNTPHSSAKRLLTKKTTKKNEKKHLSTYHPIRKAIYITKTIPLWQNHPVIEVLKNHNHITIPPPPHPNTNPQEWIKSIAVLAKTANKQARKIIIKYTQECVKKAIAKYKQLYEKSLKEINNKVFKNQDTPPLACIKDTNNNILTNPEDIANEIHIQQLISNKSTVLTCDYQPEHTNNCICGVKQYPWHDLDGFIIDTRGDPQTPLHKYFDQKTYDLYLKYLSNNKIPYPDKIPNSVLKNMHDNFHKMLLFFSHIAINKKSQHYGKQV